MISVCIATYNGEKFIREELLSILNQNRKVDEVIICDDGSKDSTVQICNRFIEENSLENWKVYENKRNKGYCLNFFSAIEKAKGDIIFLCDQDDIWYENKTQVMCDVLEKNSDILVLSSRYDIIDQKGEIIKNSKIPYLGEIFDGSIEYLSTDSFIGCSYIRGFATCFKKELKEYLKPFDLKSLLSHDWFINIIGTIKGKSAVINQKLCAYRYHTDNVSLSDMTRKTFLGDREKRVRGLEESISAHSYLLEEQFNLSKKDAKNIKTLIKTEKRRLKFLKGKNPFLWLRLVFDLCSYKRYYKSYKGAVRVFLGDFCYAYNINFKK